MARNPKAFSGIPRGNDKQALSALVQNVETFMGSRGSGLDRAVTLRELVDLNIASVRIGKGKVVGISEPEKGGESSSAVPTKPTGFAATGAWSNIILTWDANTNKHFAYTEVWRSTSDNFGSATLIDRSASAIYADGVGVNREYYYWIRHVNSNGKVSALNDTAGAYAKTAVDVDAVLNELGGQINNSHLAISLRDSIQLIADIDNLNLPPDSVLSQKIEGIVSRFELESLGNTQALAALDDQGERLLFNEASIKETQRAIANGEQAQAIINQQLNAKTQEAESSITNLIEVLASDKDTIGSIARAISQYTVSNPEGGSATLEQLAQVAYSKGENAEDLFTAQWGVKTQIADLIGGVGFYNDGNQTQFIVSADTFSIIDPRDDSAKPLLSVKKNDPDFEDGVYLSNVFIDTLAVEKIIAETVVADEFVSRTSTNVEITGGSINVNDKFTVDSLGNVLAKSLTVRDANGDTIFSSGLGISVTHIKDLLADELIAARIYAERIEGDTNQVIPFFIDNSVQTAVSLYKLMEFDVDASIVDRVLVFPKLKVEHVSGPDGKLVFEVFVYDRVSNTVIATTGGGDVIYPMQGEIYLDEVSVDVPKNTDVKVELHIDNFDQMTFKVPQQKQHLLLTKKATSWVSNLTIFD
ncbi:phage tail tip fiber protein [Gayadomonas joobiniege]|uniref:phage tail tip fiber protein n=1 Tax=Gayadomonas joobiniege TaxID=1234606 RepID=UPI00036FFD1A|nr:DUF1983 domain-containing protein [Gayadomonas joobiniege]